jgi:hypothetical protein
MDANSAVNLKRRSVVEKMAPHYGIDLRCRKHRNNCHLYLLKIKGKTNYGGSEMAVAKRKSAAKRAKPGARGGGQFFHIEVRPRREFRRSAHPYDR